MSRSQFVSRRMAIGAGTLGLYGLAVACLRLPHGLSIGTRVAAWAWALGLFAAAGMVLAGVAATLACLGARVARPPWRPTLAATIETALLIPLFAWLVLNEVVYTVTSQVLGYETALMVWADLHAVVQNAWKWGAYYLLGIGSAVVIATLVVWLFSFRSFRSFWLVRVRGRASQEGQASCPPTEPHSKPGSVPTVACGFFNHRRLAGSMTGGLALLAALLAWQGHTRPSEALTTVCRSAPPLRALNLTRALLGTGLDGTLDLRPGAPVISDAEYQALIGTPRPPAPNVIVIVLESVSAKALHCYGHSRPDVSPNLDALAAQGVLFEQCLATASFSSYGLVSILTSLDMLRAENNDHFADTSFPHLSLPQALKLAGYQLALFSSGNEAFDNINHFSPPGDFDEYFSLDTSDVPKPDCMRLDDHYAIERFESWMAARKDPRPFYCGFYLQSTHFNYEVPEPWASYYEPVPPLFSNGNGITKIPPDVLPLLKNQYDNSMRFSDYWVGRIRAALEQAHALDNSIIVIVADHGEAFMEHGLARHGVALWDEMIHIPFILYPGPAVRARSGRPFPSHASGTVSGLDVAPTIAGLVGIRPHPSWQGVDVLAPGYTSQDRPIFSVLQLMQWQEAIVLNGFKYVYDLTELQPQLFDMHSDPGETIDLISTHPELADAMKAILGTWHTRQLHYYSPQNRPLKHYLGRFEPQPELIQQFRAKLPQSRRTNPQ